MDRQRSSARNRRVGPVLLLLALAVWWAGCSSAHHRKSADNEVYRILEDYDRAVFGHTNSITNAFNINTPYSARDPKTVMAAELIADRQATNRRLVNVEAALQLAKTYSREYQTQKEQLYLAALSLTGARYAFSPQWAAGAAAQIEGEGGTATRASVGPQLSVSKLLKTGGRLSLALGNDLIRLFTANQTRVGFGNDSAVNLLTVNLAQPLLRGFGKNDPSVEALTQAERNTAYAVRTFSLYQSEFAVDIVTTYFDLLGLKRNVRNNYTNYLRRVETRQYTEARAVDRVSRTDVDDSRNQELSARISYVNSVANYLNQLDAFKLRLGLAVTEEIALDDHDLDELDAAGLTRVDISQDAAFRMATERHMDVLNAIDRFEDSKRKIRIAADQLRPGLDITGRGDMQATWYSEEPYDYTNLDFDNLRWSAGLTLDLPVDVLRERNTYRSTLISFESQLRSLVTTLDGFRDRIDRGLRNLESQRLNYISRQEALRVAERRADNNDLLFRAGRLAINRLRESQDELINAQNALTIALVGYQTTRLSLLLDLGLLVADQERFWLRDPLAGILDDSQRGRPPIEMPEDRLIPPDQFLEPLQPSS